MIVVNYLNTVFPDNLIEVRMRDHFSGLSKGILLYLRMMKDGCEVLSRVQVNSDSPLVLDLV
jgi:hypothetical protein